MRGRTQNAEAHPRKPTKVPKDSSNDDKSYDINHSCHLFLKNRYQQIFNMILLRNIFILRHGQSETLFL